MQAMPKYTKKTMQASFTLAHPCVHSLMYFWMQNHWVLTTVLNPRVTAAIQTDRNLFPWSSHSTGVHRQWKPKAGQGATLDVGGGNALGATESPGMLTKPSRGADPPRVPATSPRSWSLSPLSGFTASALVPFLGGFHHTDASWNYNFSYS